MSPTLPTEELVETRSSGWSPTLEYFPTPSWCVEAIKPHLPATGRVLDPACGEGELLLPIVGGREGVELLGLELHEARARRARELTGASIIVGDALAVDWPDADLCLANPPFSHGLAFVEKALAWRRPRATVAFLLRLTFLESRERKALHQAHPSDVFVLSERPKFRPGKDGKMSTDNVTCAWLVWGPGRGGRWSVL